VEIQVTSSHSCVVLSVPDSGPGIAPEKRAHIMESFFLRLSLWAKALGRD